MNGNLARITGLESQQTTYATQHLTHDHRAVKYMVELYNLSMTQAGLFLCTVYIYRYRFMHICIKIIQNINWFSHKFRHGPLWCFDAAHCRNHRQYISITVTKRDVLPDCFGRVLSQEKEPVLPPGPEEWRLWLAGTLCHLKPTYRQKLSEQLWCAGYRES